MNFGDCEACPKDSQAPAPAPGPVGPEEKLIRVVVGAHELLPDHAGQVKLLPTAIRKEDIRCKDGKSVSTLRLLHTTSEEISKRAIACTKEAVWKLDPVVAECVAGEMRAILDDNQRQDVCVYADPTSSEEDELGACPSHASITRSSAPPDRKYQRMALLRLQSAIAEQFTSIYHWNSRAAPNLIGQNVGSTTV